MLRSAVGSSGSGRSELTGIGWQQVGSDGGRAIAGFLEDFTP